MSQARLFEMVYLLLEKGKMSATELAERLEVSVRTVYRDVDALSAAGVPIYTTPGRRGGVALMEQFVLSRAALSDKEQGQLLTALKSLSGNSSLGTAETLSKLSALFRRSEPDWLQVDLSRWGDSGAANVKFQRLKEAILAHRAVAFTYVSSWGETTSRKAFPARLVFKGQGWYLQAFCPKKGDYRTFRLSRILGLEVTEEVFSIPLSPPPIQDAGGASPMADLRLRFSPAMAYRVYDEFEEREVSLLPDGSLEVSVSFPEDGWVYGYLLSFGAQVTILSPERIRRRVGEMAGEIFKKYKNHDTGCHSFGVTMGTSQTKEDATMKEQTFCQSCAMPLSDDLRGTEADGSPSPHYCKYCYDKGKFTQDMTMEEMIAFCAGPMAQANPDMTVEQAKAQMGTFFPQLLRWKKEGA
ncbi:MAG: WYL domain-containing protein [Oscillospiraceae bacterium]|nr:WYL domain-containing protein [Oscillospiraceae bacterium]